MRLGSAGYTPDVAGVTKPMLYGEALKLIGGLSHTGKIPWWSWSISARDCSVGSKLAEVEGTVCSSCYALKGNYMFPNVTAAHSRRKASIDDPQFVDAFVTVLTNLHAKTRKRRDDGRVENRFRWFDAGDLQSVEMLRRINDIAAQTPQIDHWLPTRELAIIKSFLASGGVFSANLQVRFSEAKIGVTPKRQPLGLPFATVGCNSAADVHQCPAASLQGNRCLDCDTCWQSKNVNYPLH
jgi:hypothetical protein